MALIYKTYENAMTNTFLKGDILCSTQKNSPTNVYIGHSITSTPNVFLIIHIVEKYVDKEINNY